MTPHHSRIEYGDSLRLRPHLSKIVDRAVVKFVNRFNHEPDDLGGFDDPLFHLPRPAESTARMCAFRRWHGADWWMVLHEDAGAVPAGWTVTRRVTILPDSMEPDTLDFLPDLVVTRGGARFILPQHKPRYHEIRRQVQLFELYRLLILETSNSEFLDKFIIDHLSKAWEYTSLFDPNEATVFVPG